jgi:ferredoxin--NADP+ reductase
MSVDLNAKVLERIEISPGLLILRVTPDGWELPYFEAGQFAVLGLPGSAARCDLAMPESSTPDPDKLIKRAYSIASSSVTKDYVEIYVSLVVSGTLTPRLFALQPGDRVWLGKKISGLFTLDEVPREMQLILISTGTGLAPYMSMLRSHSMCGERRMAVLHGARHSWELGYRSELAMLAHRCPTFTYIPVISRPAEENIPWAGETGHIQDLWQQKPLAAKWGAQPTASDSHVFLCGNPHMIEEMLVILSAEGFVEQTKHVAGQIHLERFW